MFEHRREPLLPTRAFVRRVVRFGSAALALILGALGIGILGYHLLEGLGWVDALLNAAMILGGMGPVNELHTAAGKVFAACYALFSGVVFLVAVGVFLAPIVHRFFHHFHLDLDTDGSAEGSPR
ncbi:MAG: hypothetical protein C4309_10040 [Chloroflexota bacterium]